MALTPELEAEGWSRITFDEWGEISLDDFGELPLGTSPSFVPFHVEWVGLDVTGGPSDNGWTVTNWTVHVL